jgi:hypothetical protein
MLMTHLWHAAEALKWDAAATTGFQLRKGVNELEP